MPSTTAASERSPVAERTAVRSSDGGHHFRLPAAEGMAQDEEWFEFEESGDWKRLRIHEYARVFSRPGLYEALVYDVLDCRSPARLMELFHDTLLRHGHDPHRLRALDLGAGNGVVGELLRNAGAEHVVGLDLLPEAAEAAERDRPGIYDDFLVTDLTAWTRQERERTLRHGLNALVAVAALGFGDIPPEALAQALNAIDERGWVAMTIKETFLETDDQSGFAQFLRGLFDTGVLSLESKERVFHRRSVTGRDLHYTAIVARKHGEVPLDPLAD